MSKNDDSVNDLIKKTTMFKEMVSGDTIKEARAIRAVKASRKAAKNRIDELTDYIDDLETKNENKLDFGANSTVSLEVKIEEAKGAFSSVLENEFKIKMAKDKLEVARSLYTKMYGEEYNG